MKPNWQIISLQQAHSLEALGITEPANEKFHFCHCLYSLSEIAVLLGYTFVKSNITEAADQLIQELEVGSVNAKECNERLRIANNKF